MTYQKTLRNVNAYYQVKKIPISMYCMIPNIWHSAEVKIMDTVKKKSGCQGLVGGRDK